MTKCNSFITKCDSYFKMRRLLQISKVQFSIAFHRQIQNNFIYGKDTINHACIYPAVFSY